MSLYKDMAIAVCKQDFESIKEKHKEVIGDGYIRDISTPDENYTILYWYYWNTLSDKDDLMQALRKDIEDIRHSFLSISEDGVIQKDVKTDDSRGCDELFEDILSWRADITVLGDESDIL